MDERIEKEYEIGYNELADKLGLKVNILEVQKNDTKRELYITTEEYKEKK
jgi:hypothetical protein